MKYLSNEQRVLSRVRHIESVWPWHWPWSKTNIWEFPLYRRSKVVAVLTAPSLHKVDVLHISISDRQTRICGTHRSDINISDTQMY